MQKQMDGRGIPSLLSIEDPLTPSNDIGRSSYGADKVISAFGYAYHILKRAISPQAAYHTKYAHGGVLSKLIVVTEQVTAYRAWVQQFWHQRVPRLEPERRPKTLPLRSNSISSDTQGPSDSGDESEKVESDVSDDKIASESFSDVEQPEEKTGRFYRAFGTMAQDEPPENVRSTREWDQGKLDNHWQVETGSNSTSVSMNVMTRSGESRSSVDHNQNEFRGLNDHDFPELRDRPNQKKKNSRKSEISDKESIAESDVSVTEGKKKLKPRVNKENSIFQKALGNLGTTDRIIGKDEKRGKRPTMQHYTPKIGCPREM